MSPVINMLLVFKALRYTIVAFKKLPLRKLPVGLAQNFFFLIAIREGQFWYRCTMQSDFHLGNCKQKVVLR